MPEAPKRIEVNLGHVQPDEPEWLEKQPGEEPNGPPWVMFTRADIADGYRAALIQVTEAMEIHEWHAYDDDSRTLAAHSAVHEALAKGDEG